MAFDESSLHPIINRNLALMGYHEPRPIQALAMAPILSGRDVIGLARTGTGKTAAFIAPIAHRLLTSKPPAKPRRSIDPVTRLRALVLCPTRELAQQVADEAAQIAQGSVLRVACAYGKVSIKPQIEAIERGVDILVATPGRVRELLETGAVSLGHVRHLAIDEADRMLDMGFLPQIQFILAQLRSDRQTVLFTATMPSEVEKLARQILNEPARIEAEPHTTPVEHVEQHLLPVDDDDKVGMLLHLLTQPRRRGVLIFCRTRRRVGWVFTALQRNNVEAGRLHGDMSQAQRNKSMQRFGDRELAALVATDVAARGLHVPAVKTVINYDLPSTPEEYVHRIGRAAHGGGHGESYTLLSGEKDEKLRWRGILDKLHVKVFAESLPILGRSSTRPQAAHRSDRASAGRDDAPLKRGSVKKPSKRRSRKSRPIKKGQRPGRGVVRPGSQNDR